MKKNPGVVKFSVKTISLALSYGLNFTNETLTLYRKNMCV